MLERVHLSWLPVLEPHHVLLERIDSFLDQLSATSREFAPAKDRIFRALEQPLDSVKVLIVGQDPYPTRGHAVGWAFSVERDVTPLPKSLLNIFKELSTDLDVATPAHGDLASWADQGVLLLNRVLTVEVGHAGSHEKLGWQVITDSIISALNNRSEPLVAILWGKQAQELKPLLSNATLIESAHPSPLSAYRGFFDSKPFSKANGALNGSGFEPIEWGGPKASG